MEAWGWNVLGHEGVVKSLEVHNFGVEDANLLQERSVERTWLRKLGRAAKLRAGFGQNGFYL